MDWKQELFNRIDALAVKLGTTGEYLWSVLLKQARLEGIADLGDAVFLGAMTYLLYRLARSCWGRREGSDGNTFGYIILGILSGACSIWCFSTLHVAVLELLNPGYYALEKVLQSVGK